jgi:mannose-6-phosphate isomerase-like protein (cupin superfamily)
MDDSTTGQPTAGTAARPSKPINLTAAAEPMPWDQACRMTGVTGPSNGVALDVLGLTPIESARFNDGSRETVYVVVSGFGVLRSDRCETQCTAGDVLFVPRGCPHHFERLDGHINIWSISPAG